MQESQARRRPLGRSLEDFRIETAATLNALLPAEERLLASSARGEICEIDSTRPLVRAETNEIRGGFVRFLALGGDNNAPVHERCLAIRRAFIVGDIDLENAEKLRPFLLIECNISGKIVGKNGVFTELNFNKSIIGGLEFQCSKVSGAVYLGSGLIVDGDVKFYDSKIGGMFFCRGGSFRNPNEMALNCGGMNVSGGVFLDEGFEASGEVSFPGAKLGAVLRCRGGRFENAGKTALGFGHAKIGGAVDIRNMVCEGEVSFEHASIAGIFDCSKSQINNREKYTVNCKNGAIGGDILLNDGFTSVGKIVLTGVEVGGALDCRGAGLVNPNDQALVCEGATIGGSVLLSEGFKSLGEVNFRNAQINGQVDCTNGIFDNPGGTTIDCDRAEIGGAVFLSGGFSSRGRVSFFGAEIARQFMCDDGKFDCADGVALDCVGAECAGGVFLRSGFSSQGKVSFTSARIIGDFECDGGTFRNAGNALDCDLITVAGMVSLRSGFSADGAVLFFGARIASDFACSGGRFSHPVIRNQPDLPERIKIEDCLDLYGAKIGGTLTLGPAGPVYEDAKFIGDIDLQSAQAKAFIDSETSWPVQAVSVGGNNIPCCIILDGFSYERFARAAPTDSKTRQRWLLRQPQYHLTASFRPQPFEQIIKVLREMGHEADARHIAMLKQSLQQQRKRIWKQPFAWTVGWLWGFSCGYGYRPTRLFVMLLVLWVGCGWLYKIGAEEGGFAPKDAQIWTNREYNKDCDTNWTVCAQGDGGKVTEVIAFNPFTYSADMLLPAIDLGQRSAWTPLWREIKVKIPCLGERTLPRWALRSVSWTENVLGVTGVILIGAILSGLVKHD
jgi:hypothetical protein